MQETSSNKLSTGKAVVGIFLSIAILVIAQTLAFSISELVASLGIPTAICNISAAILYVIFTFWGAKLICKKFLKVSMKEMRIPHFKLKKVWCMTGLVMPILVLVIAVMLGGHWEVNRFDAKTTVAICTAAIAFYGLAAGIVEEVVFRGLVMGCLEKRFNITIAVLVPSILFGLLHILGNELDFISIVQLIIAGSIVGILFSLIAYESNSVWNNAIVHGFWNMAIIGGILYIGNSPSEDSIFNFVLENKSFLLSGGDFGIEASVIAILVYLIFIGVAFVLLKKKQSK